MKSLGVTRIIAPSAVGSLNRELAPGSIVLPDQFVDFTKGREYSFYDDEAVHISLADPFCDELAETAEGSARHLGIPIRRGGTYVSVEGPRFSTRAESRFFKDVLKGDIIGMTLVPEVSLAREAELCYLTIATVTDYDVWEEKPVSADDVSAAMGRSSEQVRKLIGDIITNAPNARNCICKDALKGARL
jgi:5'-methylthioadenosine phosphorylase